MMTKFVNNPMMLKLVKVTKQYYWRLNEFGRYNCLICGEKVEDDLAYFDTTGNRGWFHVGCILDK